MRRVASALLALLFITLALTAEGQLSTFLEKKEVDRVKSFLSSLKQADDFESLELAYIYSNALPGKKHACDYLAGYLVPNSKPKELYYAVHASVLAKCDWKASKATFRTLEGALSNPSSPSLADMSYAAWTLALLESEGKKVHVDWAAALSELMTRLGDNGKFVDFGDKKESLTATAYGYLAMGSILPKLDRSSNAAIASKVARLASRFFESSSQEDSVDGSASEIQVYTMLVMAYQRLKAFGLDLPSTTPSKIIEYLELLVPFCRTSTNAASLGFAYMGVKTALALPSPPVGVTLKSPIISANGDNIILKADVCGLAGEAVSSVSEVVIEASPLTGGQSLTLANKPSGSCTFSGKVPLSSLATPPSDEADIPKIANAVTIKVALGGNDFSVVRPTGSSAFFGAVTVSTLDITVANSTDKNTAGAKKIYTVSSGKSTFPTQHLTDNSNMFIDLQLSGEYTVSALVPHQAAVVMSLKKAKTAVPKGLYTDRLLHFTPKPSGHLSLQINFGLKRHAIPLDGVYSLKLVVGDPRMDAQIERPLGEVVLTFSAQLKTLASPLPKGELLVLPSEVAYHPLPLIHHQFKPPAKQANPVISAVFLMGTTVLPLGYLLYATDSYGANVGCISLMGAGEKLTSLLFEACKLALVFVLFLFYLQINLIQTLMLLVPIGVITTVIGNRALCVVKSLRASEKLELVSGDKKRE